MKNIGNTIPNIIDENKEKKPELKAVPIFRNNDLYAELFPEIKPVFEKGEKAENNVKKIIEAILKNENKAVVLDETCEDALSCVRLEDFPEKFNLKEIPKNKNGYGFDINAFRDLLKIHFNIELKKETIDSILGKKIGRGFSQELIKSLFEIAKQKNKNIKKVYILTKSIDDHVNSSEKEKVLPILIEEVKQNFGMDPIIIPTIHESQIQEGDLIIADRHNELVFEAVKRKPTQFSVLPIETELSNNERYLENKIEKDRLVTLLRKEFEKEKESKP